MNKLHDKGQSMLMWVMFVIMTLFLFFTVYTLLAGYWKTQIFDLGVRLGANSTVMGLLEQNFSAAPFIFGVSVIVVFIFYTITRG
jgi:hypothetical protein